MDSTAALVVLLALAVGLFVGGLMAVGRRGVVFSGGSGGAGHLNGQLQALSAELGRVQEAVSRAEQGRSRQHGELASQLSSLGSTAGALRDALANPRARGQWGERMAGDILAMAGLVEGLNYRTQTAVPGGGVPDYTFFLPRELVLHMDVKFPMDNYVRALEASAEAERLRCRGAFLKDVRARVAELRGRGYVDPGGGTVDFVLLFMPNESVYSFVHEHDPALLELALRAKVVLCSPLTLFAMLAVIRQTVDAFSLQQASDEALSLLGAFADQWGRFATSLDRLGRAVDGVERAYGELTGTRRRALERPLERLDELRRGRGLPVAAMDPGLRVVEEM